MLKLTNFALFIVLTLTTFGFSQEGKAPDSSEPHKRPRADRFDYGKNKLTISFLGHASLILEFNATIIYIDPVRQYADYANLPRADLIFITHEHSDHLDPDVITRLTKKDTQIILNQSSFNKIKTGMVLANGQTWEADNIKVEAVPAYNTTPGREQFHPKGRDNGYILTLAGKRIYIAGDTEDIPEMAEVKNTDIAFLPMNQPYTMTPEQVTRAVEMIQPKIVYPYHYGDTNPEKLVGLLTGLPQVELRIRDLR